MYDDNQNHPLQPFPLKKSGLYGIRTFDRCDTVHRNHRGFKSRTSLIFSGFIFATANVQSITDCDDPLSYNYIYFPFSIVNKTEQPFQCFLGIPIRV